MKKFLYTIKEFVFDILFPKFCVKCNKEGSYLCQDCFYLVDVFEKTYCPFCQIPGTRTCLSCQKTKKLAGLFCAASYDNHIVKTLINQFKYPPYVKEMAKPIASLILAHFLKLESSKETRSPEFLKTINNENSVIIPVPLYKKKLKKRGFNQAEEIAKELSKTFKIPLFADVLIKTKETPAQTELNKEQRKKNVSGVFLVQNPEAVRDKIVFLIDDVITTGSTLEECSQTLKEAKEVWGVTAARGQGRP